MSHQDTIRQQFSLHLNLKSKFDNLFTLLIALETIQSETYHPDFGCTATASLDPFVRLNPLGMEKGISFEITFLLFDSSRLNSRHWQFLDAKRWSSGRATYPFASPAKHGAKLSTNWHLKRLPQSISCRLKILALKSKKVCFHNSNFLLDFNMKMSGLTKIKYPPSGKKYLIGWILCFKLKQGRRNLFWIEQAVFNEFIEGKIENNSNNSSRQESIYIQLNSYLLAIWKRKKTIPEMWTQCSTVSISILWDNNSRYFLL